MKNHQGVKLCEEIKALAIELAESFQKETQIKGRILISIIQMSKRLHLLKDKIDASGFREKERDLKLYAQQFIAKHSAQSLNLNNFARFLGYSPKYCSRLFKAQTGETFSQYTTKLRIDLAVHMLLETSEPVSAIAELSGFSDPFVFSHFFKRVIGCSPMKFRAAQSSGQAYLSILQPEGRPPTKRRAAPQHYLESAGTASIVASAMQVESCNRSTSDSRWE